METLSHRLAAAIKNANAEETCSIEIMQYAISILINSVMVLVVSLLINSVFGVTLYTLLTFFALVFYRFCSGGAHFKTARACNVFSILVCTSIPHLALLMNDRVLLAMNCLSIILAIAFAPNPDPRSQLPFEIRPWLKTISILLVMVNFFLYSYVIGLVFFIQSLTIIPLRRGCSHEEKRS